MEAALRISIVGFALLASVDLFGRAFGHGFAFEPSERSTPLTLPGSCSGTSYGSPSILHTRRGSRPDTVPGARDGVICGSYRCHARDAVRSEGAGFKTIWPMRDRKTTLPRSGSRVRAPSPAPDFPSRTQRLSRSHKGAAVAAFDLGTFGGRRFGRGVFGVGTISARTRNRLQNRPVDLPATYC